ncbi:hypothetical protein [Catenibacillus scindens]|uniref:hypothetical protein n=1 Tax=Catenibacillus scindens TaxID=673271 RepID=UPI003208749E
MKRKLFICLTAVCVSLGIVAACMYMPGALVSRQGRGDIGLVYSGGQQYYGDAVSAGDMIDFDLRTRLAMLSGQWKCDKKEVYPASIEDNVMKESDAQIFAMDFLQCFTDVMWFYLTDMMVNMGVPWDEFNVYHEPIAAWLNGASGRNVWFAQSEGTGWAPDRFQVQEIIDAMYGAQCQLYRYSDAVLDTYYFYVWECIVELEDYGVRCSLMVDAVTMDVYDIYIGGDIFAMLHWKPAMEELLDGLGMYDIFNDGIYNVSLNLQDYKVFVPAIIRCYVNQAAGYGSGYGQYPIAISIPWDQARDYQTSQEGYSFDDNFFRFHTLYGTALADSPDICFRAENGSLVYACTDFSEGFHWFMTADQHRRLNGDWEWYDG